MVVLAEALTNIQVFADASVITDVSAETTQRFITGALGLHVDATADTGTGRGYTVDEGVRAFEHFDTFQGIGGNDLSRQDAVQAIKGNVVAIEGQATNHKGLGLVGISGSLTHR
ncbi:hypothetical protein D3C72_1420430 [compost metagenome]